jgi:hypothetical protein
LSAERREVFRWKELCATSKRDEAPIAAANHGVFEIPADKARGFRLALDPVFWTEADKPDAGSLPSPGDCKPASALRWRACPERRKASVLVSG